MKRKLVLWAAVIACIVCATACTKIGQGAGESDSKTEIEEITFQGGTVEKGKSPSSLSSALPSPNTNSKNTKKKKSYQRIRSKAKIQDYGGTIQIGGAAFELYHYVESSAEKYTSVINKVASKLKETADVYAIVAPTSVGVTLPDNKKNKVNSSNQKESIQKIYGKLNKNVTCVSLHDTLMQHRTEYIYFRTDHHWTDKGAYYAYQEFSKAKGVTPHALSEYKTKKFGDYLGTFYTETNESKTLRQDMVKAFYPVENEKIKMTYMDENGTRFDSSVICDGSNYSIRLKYCAFIAGDNPLSVIKNKEKKDGSTCLVIKESYGNAFVPYLADHYQKIYVIDYRYWQGSISGFVKKKDIQDVVFLNNISMTRNAYLIGKLAQVQ